MTKEQAKQELFDKTQGYYHESGYLLTLSGTYVITELELEKLIDLALSYKITEDRNKFEESFNLFKQYCLDNMKYYPSLREGQFVFVKIDRLGAGALAKHIDNKTALFNQSKMNDELWTVIKDNWNVPLKQLNEYLTNKL